MIELHITGGVVLIDDEDYEYLSQFKWHLQNGYPTHSKDMYTHLTMHRVLLAKELLAAPKKTQVDHIDKNKCNNQRSNLRLCTGSQNMRNSISGKIKKYSEYRGVSMNHGKYCAYSWINGKNTFLGRYSTDIEAALAYDAAAREYHGEFATLNFP